jgi:hypothetical protein
MTFLGVYALGAITRRAAVLDQVHLSFFGAQFQSIFSKQAAKTGKVRWPSPFFFLRIMLCGVYAARSARSERGFPLPIEPVIVYGRSLLNLSTTAFDSVTGGLFKYFPKNTRYLCHLSWMCRGSTNPWFSRG